jgi:predicted nucleic acid-binding protein
MDYLDTSVVIAALTDEPSTQRVQTWLEYRSTDDLHVSQWVITEVSSALSMKVRMGTLSQDHRTAAQTFFRQMIAESLTVLPLRSLHFHAAALLADQHQLGLRAGDALHLAVATDVGATLYTLDKRLAEAGQRIGASVQLL